MKITSWNINSVRIRLDSIKRFVDQINPDILCLQETKAQDIHFPADALRQMGFEHMAFRGQKSYNGVAILSKVPLTNPRHERFVNKEEERHICATLPDGSELHNFYVPAGGDVPDIDENPKFKDKLEFVDRITQWSAENRDKKMIMLGDMNIAPLEHDVWSHKQLLKVVSHTPIEVEKLLAAQNAASWIDTLREFTPAHEKLYSWWSYRSRDWKTSNRGRRLDHIWITPPLKDKLKSGSVFEDARGWDSPSDHAPITIELGEAA